MATLLIALFQNCKDVLSGYTYCTFGFVCEGAWTIPNQVQKCWWMRQVPNSSNSSFSHSQYACVGAAAHQHVVCKLILYQALYSRTMHSAVAGLPPVTATVIAKSRCYVIDGVYVTSCTSLWKDV